MNLVACSFARIEAPKATTVIRTSNVEYIELWREGRLDVDFAVSSELETAHAVSRSIGMPAARQTDVFARGQVQIVEFDVLEGADAALVGPPLREAPHPGRLARRSGSSAATPSPSRAAARRSRPATGSS